jgi:hypothetical protein
MSTDPPPELPADDVPVPIRVAVKLFFPYGGMTVSGLRNEHRKGRLVITRMGGRDYVTRKDIRAMQELCRIVRVPEQPPVVIKPNQPSLEERKRLASLALEHTVRDLRRPKKT